MTNRLLEGIVVCGHEECERTYTAPVQLLECFIFGELACMVPGCFCSQYQATNPIRRGIGEGIIVGLETGEWKRSYPYATEAARQDPQRRVMIERRNCPW